MSEQIKHECGITLIRLRKPLDFYVEKYGTALYGLHKLHLMMQKQRNRGQDGAGIATIKIGVRPGERYISRKRSNQPDPLRDVFEQVYAYFKGLSREQLADAAWLKACFPYVGELLLGHLRYGTHGSNSIETVHPFLRQSNYINRNLVLAGNFNLTNVDELFEELISYGQYPKEKSDTVTILEKIGHFLDDEVQRLHTWFKPDGYTNQEINDLIFEHLDLQRLLRRATKKFDGGYVITGMIGHGDAFVIRDPNGIRPAFFYQDDEVVVCASERPAIQTAFDVHYSKVEELPPAHALIIKRNGSVAVKPFTEPAKHTACSFERIYFSRGTDRDIYEERKKLGEHLVDAVLEAVDYDFKHTVFSFVPNSAEAAFYGLVHGIEARLDKMRIEKVRAMGDDIKPKKLQKILSLRARVEKVIVKDAKLRTFIADDSSRGDMVTYGYDVTYGIIRNGKDTLVLMDDSIVRGTTLKNSIIAMAARLRPRRIIIVSSAPQIRYPDCYGIDMSKMKDFVAFRALVELLKEHGKEHLLKETYERCKAQEALPKEQIRNEVKPLYDQFSYEQISDKVAEIVTPPGISAKVKVIYQTLEGLRRACPHHRGDWYFSGDYPTPGGNRVVNRAFVNFMENRDERAYL